jgi:hypothetical protein
MVSDNKAPDDSKAELFLMRVLILTIAAATQPAQVCQRSAAAGHCKVHLTSKHRTACTASLNNLLRTQSV